MTVKYLLGESVARYYLEATLDRLPREKTLSVALMRYSKEGLVERRRVGRSFRYRLTEKGEDRILFLDSRLNKGKHGQPSGQLAVQDVSDNQQSSRQVQTPSQKSELQDPSYKIFYLEQVVKFQEEARAQKTTYESLIKRLSHEYYSALRLLLNALQLSRQENQELKELIRDLVNHIIYWKRQVKNISSHYSMALTDIDSIIGELREINRERIQKGERLIRIKTEPHPSSIGILTYEPFSEIPQKALEIAGIKPKSQGWGHGAISSRANRAYHP